MFAGSPLNNFIGPPYRGLKFQEGFGPLLPFGNVARKALLPNNSLDVGFRRKDEEIESRPVRSGSFESSNPTTSCFLQQDVIEYL
jgi:hypothetical protein